jgi:hypothetical protein
MRTLIGDRPATQMIIARWIERGDYVATASGPFSIVTDIDYVAEIDLATVAFLDGATWLGEGDRPMPVATSRSAAADWNRRLSELDLGQWAQLNGFPC